MANKWMTADEWRATVGVERETERARARAAREEWVRAQAERGMREFYADLAKVKSDQMGVSTPVSTDRAVAERVVSELRDLGWRAELDDVSTSVFSVYVVLPE